MDNALIPSQHLNHAPDHIRNGDASVCYHWFIDIRGLEVDTGYGIRLSMFRLIH